MKAAEILKPIIPKSLLHPLLRIYQTSSHAFFSLLARLLSAHSTSESTGLTFFFESLPYNHLLVIKGYSLGIFPSSIKGDGVITWHDPEERGVLPITDFHVPKKLRSLLRQNRFELKVDHDLRAVMKRCAQNRDKTHITPEYIDVYMELHKMGLVHSVSTWQDNELVGGHYGFALGAYFASESGFHLVRDAGKAATVRLAEILIAGGYLLHDTWWYSDNIAQYGGKIVKRKEFHDLHTQAISAKAHFDPNTPMTISTGKAEYFN